MESEKGFDDMIRILGNKTSHTPAKTKRPRNPQARIPTTVWTHLETRHTCRFMHVRATETCRTSFVLVYTRPSHVPLKGLGTKLGSKVVETIHTIPRIANGATPTENSCVSIFGLTFRKFHGKIGCSMAQAMETMVVTPLC